MSAHPWWYAARATGIMAWLLLSLSILAGARMVGRRRKTIDEQLDVHRVLGGLGVIFAGAHVAALLLDHFVGYGFREVLLPLASVWRPGPVAWGVVGLYLLVVIEVSSLLQRHMSRARWRRIHDHSYYLFAVITIHFLTAGSDVARWLPLPVTVALGAAAIGVSARGFLQTRSGASNPERYVP